MTVTTLVTLNISNIGFIKIQNITTTIERPCVLDIKLGLGKLKTDKKLSMTTECFSFRICGMSVYQVKLGMFLFRDKYWGRNLQVAELKDALTLFFHNGNFIPHSSIGKELNILVLRKFIKLIEKAYLSIGNTKGIRLVSSSLLLVYDAVNGTAKLKLIDFENAEQTLNQEVDHQALEGISNLNRYLKEIEKEH